MARVADLVIVILLTLSLRRVFTAWITECVNE